MPEIYFIWDIVEIYRIQTMNTLKLIFINLCKQFLVK